MEGGQPLHVAKTVLLELEWVMRGAYAGIRQSPINFLVVCRTLAEADFGTDSGYSDQVRGLPACRPEVASGYEGCAGSLCFTPCAPLALRFGASFAPRLTCL